jgi:hypothetical protein
VHKWWVNKEERADGVKWYTLLLVTLVRLLSSLSLSLAVSLLCFHLHNAELPRRHTLEHNGVLFPPPYEPHGIPVYYEGKPVKLTPEQEEIATFYAQYLETDHVKKTVFNENFFKDWLKVLQPYPCILIRWASHFQE